MSTPSQRIRLLTAMMFALSIVGRLREPGSIMDDMQTVLALDSVSVFPALLSVAAMGVQVAVVVGIVMGRHWPRVVIIGLASAYALSAPLIGFSLVADGLPAATAAVVSLLAASVSVTIIWLMMRPSVRDAFSSEALKDPRAGWSER